MRPQLPLYQQLAHHISSAITAGSLRAGDKLASVRALAGSHRVSLSTAVQAYRHLENQGWIEARPKSGYFVKTLRSSPQDRERSPAPDASLAERMQLIRQPDLLRLDIAIGPPEMYPTKKIQQIIAQVSRGQPDILTSYPTGTGHPELKAQIARRALDAGCSLRTNDILITSGSTESLQLALRAVTQAGDTVAIESPSYFGILQILQSLGLHALEITTHPVTGISIDALEFATRAVGAVQAVLLMPNFQNPLGSLMPDAHKKSVVTLLTERRIPLIEDDVYGDIYFGNARPLCAKAYDTEGNVILCNSTTKTLAPGLRIGWLSAGRWQEQLAKLKLNSSMVTPELAQAAIARFMQDGGYDHHLRKFRAAVRQQTTRMREAVLRYFPSESECSLPQGGYLIWVKLPPAISAHQLFELAQQAGIGIAPGAMFTNADFGERFIRLNCAYPWSGIIESSVKTLGEIAHDLVRRQDGNAHRAVRPA